MSSDVKAYNHYLRRIDLSLVEREACQQELRNSSLGVYFELNDGDMCAKSESLALNSCKVS